MRLVCIDQVNHDDILARPLYDIDGRKLLNSGISLRPSIVEKLHEKGISSIYIEDELSAGVEINSLLSEETRNRAKMVIRNEMNKLARKKDIDFTLINTTVDMILDEMLSRKIDVLNVKDIRMQDEFIFAHSLNVCVMSAALATRLSLPVSKVKSIAIGAFLHDIGKALLPPDILMKEKPSESEAAEIRKHPSLGYNIIKDNMDAAPTAKITILMHHEQINGNGYPMGLSGDKIHYSAKIVNICDAFDQAINDRKYRNAYQTTDAVEYLIGASGHIFDKSFVDEFIKLVPIYPEGAIVLLSNGVFAIVLKNNSVNMTRPLVRAFYNPKNQIKYDESHIIDLQNELSVKIIREVNVNMHEIIK